MAIRAIVFNLGGTVAAFDGVAPLVAAFEKNGFTVSRQRLAGLFDRSRRDAIDAVLLQDFKVADAALSEKILFAFFSGLEAEASKAREIGSARKVFAELEKRGVKTCVASGFPRALSKKILAAAGLQGACLVSGGEVSRARPAPDIVLAALEKIGCSAKDALVVGPAPMDVKAGKAAGALTAAVLSGGFGLRALQAENPDYVFQDLGGVLSIPQFVVQE